jgi:hypothetical protein
MPGNGEGITDVLVKEATSESECSSLRSSSLTPRKHVLLSIGIYRHVVSRPTLKVAFRSAKVRLLLNRNLPLAALNDSSSILAYAKWFGKTFRTEGAGNKKAALDQNSGPGRLS